MKQLAKWFFLLFGALIFIGAAVYFCGWLLSLRAGESVLIPETAVLSATAETEVGEPVLGTLRFDLPLSRSVQAAEVRPGDGAVLAGAVRIERGAWKFTRQGWNVIFDLRALRAGEIAPGTVLLELSGETPETVERKIPGFSARLAASAPNGELKLAEAIAIEKPPPWGWIAAGAVFGLAVLALVIRLILNRRVPEPPLWERTQKAIGQLKTGLASGDVRPEQGYIRLTDLVRSYLEERYGIPVSTRTTPEFLADVNGPDSPLPKEERPFLREFLEAADRVKFAALTPDPELLAAALEKAAALVEATRPVDEGRKGGGK